MSGFFPLSENMDELEYNLENKIEMISQVPQWHPELPTGIGYLKDRSRFDSGFFGKKIFEPVEGVKGWTLAICRYSPESSAMLKPLKPHAHGKMLRMHSRCRSAPV